jgi:hypothetical protein
MCVRSCMGYKKTKNFDEIRCDLTLIEINIICDVPFNVRIRP